MKSLSKKIVAIALGGFLLMGIGSTVTEASPAHGHNAPQVEYYDHGEPPPPPPQREREHHKKNNNGAIIAGAIIGAVIANNL
ncbi:MAG: hypothetical protein H6Q70_1631 [Firmicutes bacterium]|nr:hypothetical protein [Bacillota bacterium]